MEEKYIKVSEVLRICKEAAKTNRELAVKCIESSGKGESQISSLGGAAYFLEQARIYEYDIPMTIKSISTENKEAFQEKPKKQEYIPIESLDLSTKAYNGLKRNGIEFLHELTGMYLFELKKIRGLGNKSLIEILETLKARNISLKE